MYKLQRRWCSLVLIIMLLFRSRLWNTRSNVRFFSQNSFHKDPYLKKSIFQKLPQMAQDLQWDRMTEFLQTETKSNPKHHQTLYINALHNAMNYENFSIAKTFANTFLKEQGSVPVARDNFTLDTLVKYWTDVSKNDNNIISLYDQSSCKNNIRSKFVLEKVLRMLRDRKDFDGMICRIKSNPPVFNDKTNSARRDPALHIYSMGIAAATNTKHYNVAAKFLEEALRSIKEGQTAVLKDEKNTAATVVSARGWIYANAITAAASNEFNLKNDATQEGKNVAAASDYLLSLVTQAAADVSELHPSTIVTVMQTLGSRKEWQRIQEFYSKIRIIPNDNNGRKIAGIAIRALYANKENQRVLDTVEGFRKKRMCNAAAYTTGCLAAAAVGNLEAVVTYRSECQKLFSARITASSAVRAACQSNKLDEALSYHQEELEFFNDAYTFTMRMLMEKLYEAKRYEDVITAYNDFASKVDVSRKRTFKTLWRVLINTYESLGDAESAATVRKKGDELGLNPID